LLCIQEPRERSEDKGGRGEKEREGGNLTATFIDVLCCWFSQINAKNVIVYHTNGVLLICYIENTQNEKNGDNTFATYRRNDCCKTFRGSGVVDIYYSGIEEPVGLRS